MTRGRSAWRAGIAALLLLPFTYAWLPLAERSPGWLLILVPLAEVGAVALGIAAIWIGVQARRDEGDSSASRWGIWLGALALTLVVTGNVLGVALLN